MIQTWNQIPSWFLEQGRKEISRNTQLFVQNAPWRKLIARKQKWVCTFGKAYLKYEIGAFQRAPSKKNQRMTKFSFFLFYAPLRASVSKNEVFTKCISFFNHSFDRHDSPEAGHTQFTRPILLLEQKAYAITSCSHVHIPYPWGRGPNGTLVAGRQRSRGEEKWDYLPIQKKAKMGAKST